MEVGVGVGVGGVGVGEGGRAGCSDGRVGCRCDVAQATLRCDESSSMRRKKTGARRGSRGVLPHGVGIQLQRPVRPGA